MRIGTGRRQIRITLRRPLTTTGRSGATKVTWEDSCTVWAERVRLTGSSIIEAAEQFPDYRADFNVRDAHEVAEKWQVQEEGGNLYIVENIIPNAIKGYNTLQCVRYNE